MDASDPVSCLLCLSAYERSSMLRVHLQAIASDSTSVYYFCQKCGGAIAAEYLYIQNSGKAEATIAADLQTVTTDTVCTKSICDDPRCPFEHPPLIAPTADVGEEKPIEVRADAHEEPAGGKKKARK